MRSRLSSPWLNGFRGKYKYCKFCQHVDGHDENCIWLYASQLEEYYEASQAVEKGAVDFDLHNETVVRLHKATDALRGE